MTLAGHFSLHNKSGNATVNIVKTTMSALVKECAAYLRLLSSTVRTQRKALLKTATRRQILAIKEIFVNLLRGNVPLSSQQKKTLSRHAKKIRQLATTRLTKEKLMTYLSVVSQVLSCIVPFLAAAV